MTVIRSQPPPKPIEIVEVQPSPLEEVPPEILPQISSEFDGTRDKIDLRGPLAPTTLPGVSANSGAASSTSRPGKKSLFARQREAKRSQEPIQSSSTKPDTPEPHTTETALEAPHILADLVERDVVSFGDMMSSTIGGSSTSTGFPETEKLEPTAWRQETANAGRKFVGAENVTSPASRVFYSSARDRLDRVETIEVDDEDEEVSLPSAMMAKEGSSRGQDLPSLMREISSENDASLNKMSAQDVENLQKELMAALNPKFIEMLKQRGQQKSQASNNAAAAASTTNDQSATVAASQKPKLEPESSTIGTLQPQEAQNEEEQEIEEETSVHTSTGVYQVPAVGRNKKRSTYLADIERKKREWLLPVEERRAQRKLVDDAAEEGPKYMQVEGYRFDFEGRLLSYQGEKGRVVVEEKGKSQDLNMLLHHGAEPAEPGYTLDELAHLARSTHPSQRISSLRALGNIIYKAKHAYYTLPVAIPRSFAYFPSSLFLSHLLHELFIPITLRIALDDPSNTIALEALYALHALMVSDSDEIATLHASLDGGSPSYYPMQPRDEDNISLSKQDWDDKSDTERCELDLVLALLQTGLLARFRYLLDAKSSSQTITTLIFQLMLRIARHSQEACDHFEQCPQLMKSLKLQLSSSTSSAHSNPNTSLLLTLIKTICQGSRNVCDSAIRQGLVSSVFPFIRMPSPSAGDPSSTPLFIKCTLESIGLLETCIRYGLFKSSVLNIISILLDIVGWKSISTAHHERVHLIQAAVWRLFSAMVPLARDIPEGEEIPSFVILWSHISPSLPLALSALRSFEAMVSTASSTDTDALLSAILDYLAAYFDQLLDYPPRSFEDEKNQIRFISQKTLSPFLIRSPYFSSIVIRLSETNSWKSQPAPSTYFNVALDALFTLDLKSHPTWSWKVQKPLSSDGTFPLTTLQQNLAPRLAPNTAGSTLLSNAAVLLSALRVVSAISKHDAWLSASLTASEVASPLSALLAHYSDWAMTHCSSALGSVYSTRVLHHLALFIIKLLYRSSLTAQESGLICLAHLLPGDELPSLELVQRISLYYEQQDAADMAPEDSLYRRLNVPARFASYLMVMLTEGLEIVDGKSARLARAETQERRPRSGQEEPSDRESLLIDVEASAQPLGKNWIYNPFEYYARQRAIEENELSLRRHKARSDAIKKSVEAHFEAESKTTSASSTANEVSIDIELPGNVELFGDYEDENSKSALAAGIDFIRDTLQFAYNVETANMSFAQKLKLPAKIYSLVQVITLGPKFFMDAKISSLINQLLLKHVSVGWAPLHLGFVINTGLIEKLADIWANESFGDATVGNMVALWLGTAAELSPSQVLASGQASELRALDAALWPQFSTLWHLLPPPPAAIQAAYFNENVVHRALVAEHLLVALCSPHTASLRQQWHFWYRFVVYMLSRYFLSNHPDNVNTWIRLNSFQSLLDDLTSTPASSLIPVFHDLFLGSQSDFISNSPMAIDEAKLLQRQGNEHAETLLAEFRSRFLSKDK